MRQFATRRAAMQDKAGHAFQLGIGYIAEGRPEVPVGSRALGSAAPPEATLNGTRHTLRSPQGALVVCRWDAVQGVWEAQGGNRLGWTPEYLTQSGWVYVGFGVRNA